MRILIPLVAGLQASMNRLHRISVLKIFCSSLFSKAVAEIYTASVYQKRGNRTLTYYGALNIQFKEIILQLT